MDKNTQLSDARSYPDSCAKNAQFFLCLCEAVPTHYFNLILLVYTV